MTIDVYNTSIREHLFAVYMAKLYWRVKKNGKWTWTPAQVIEAAFPGEKFTAVENLEEEE
jgi:hypothetical protein